LAQDTSSSKAS